MSNIARSAESHIKIKKLVFDTLEMLGISVSDANGTGAAWARNGLLLADDLFLAAHDDVTGKLRLTNRAIGLGLAGALLGELMLFRKITLRQGLVAVLDRRPVPDALAHLILEDVLGEPQPRPVRDWLRYLGRNAGELVAQRMVREGLLRVLPTRRFRRSTGYRPVDVNAAAWPIVRLAQKLARQETLVLSDIVLAGLITATGLDRHLRAETVVDVTRYQHSLIVRLPAQLRVLVAETEAAIGEAVLYHRK